MIKGLIEDSRLSVFFSDCFVCDCEFIEDVEAWDYHKKVLNKLTSKPLNLKK